MDNLGALKRIEDLVNSYDPNTKHEFESLLSASTILQKDGVKIAIIGSKQKGKSKLVNLLAKKKICKNPSISIPICISFPCNPERNSLVSPLCKSNNISTLRRNGSFYWTKTQSVSKMFDTLDETLQHVDNDALGVFFEVSNLAEKRISLILPEDLSMEKNSNEVIKSNLNAADIADIIIIVGTPSEINSKMFDFLYSTTNVIGNKTVIAVVIHKDKTVFCHYPLSTPCNEANEIEKTFTDSIKNSYELINKKSTSVDMIEMLKKGITKDSQNYWVKNEALIVQNYKKAKNIKAFFISTEESAPQKMIKEDNAILDDIIKWQDERIYSEIIMVIVNEVSKKSCPFVVWDYYFRKIEDFCFDLTMVKSEDFESSLAGHYARTKTINHILSIQKKDLLVLLRDYDGHISENELKRLYSEYLEKTSPIRKIVPGNKKAIDDIQNNISIFMEESTYANVCQRIKQQYSLELKPGKEIIRECINSNQDFDSNTLVKRLEDSISKDTIVKIFEEKAPLVMELKRVQDTINLELSKKRKELLDLFESWIHIAELVDSQNTLCALISKRDYIATFSPEKLFL